MVLATVGVEALRDEVGKRVRDLSAETWSLNRSDRSGALLICASVSQAAHLLVSQGERRKAEVHMDRNAEGLRHWLVCSEVSWENSQGICALAESRFELHSDADYSGEGIMQRR